MLMYERFQKFYLLWVLFLGKLLKKVLLKIKRVNQSEGENTGTEIIRVTLKGCDKCVQHKAPGTQTAVVELVEGSCFCLCNKSSKREMGATSNSSRRKRWKIQSMKEEGSPRMTVVLQKRVQQLRQDKERFQEGCFQGNNWNV